MSNVVVNFLIYRWIIGLIHSSILLTSHFPFHSPFGQRCDSIHDPRTKAIDPNNQFWLPHCVLETKKLLTDVHIDWCKKLSFVEIHYGHTFGLFKGKLQQEQKNIIEMCFDDFYSSVIESTKSASNDANEIFPTMKKALTEAQRNEIALKMSYITADSDFSSNFENTRNGTTGMTSTSFEQ